MKKWNLLLLFLTSGFSAFAQDEVKPEGYKLLYFLGILAVILLVWMLFRKKGGSGISFFNLKRVSVELDKDRLYYPDTLYLKVKNTGNRDIDLDKPLMIFDNFWLKRKFRIKGMESYHFYPLFLEKGKTHRLTIDLNRFYRHDKRLKRYPKIIIQLNDVKGKKLGRKSIYLRKTLVKF